jgi:zinc protease
MRLMFCVVALCTAAPCFANVTIPYERFTLANGLRVIVHEDRKAPIVAIRVAYQVGAKNEPVGKTGFAHLFEHLMYRGSENVKGNFFEALDNAGATDMNAETSQDATQYFAIVPTPALDLALWLESDRMGHLLGAITEETLNAERGVVQNEKRDGEGELRTQVFGRAKEALFPEGHPYRRMVVGSMEDLNGASVDDARAWFRKYYGATNAIVVLSGDIDAKTARAKMEKYFGDVPVGEPLHRMTAWVPQLAADVRESMHARVGQRSLLRYWPVPGQAARERKLLEIAADILSGSLEARLHGEIVEKRGLATAATATVEVFEIAGMFEIAVDMKPGSDSLVIERAIDEQLRQFLEQGPTRAEMRKIKADLEASELFGLQSVASKAGELASAELFTGDPSFGDTMLQWVRDATPEEIRRVAREWLGKPHYQLTVHPFGDHQVTDTQLDRSRVPTVNGELSLQLPPMQEATLSNGLKVVLAERHEVPAIAMTLVLTGAGTQASPADKPGSAAVAYTLMNNGPASSSRASYAKQLEKMYASIEVSVGARDASSSLAVLKKNLRPALALWRQVLRRPAFRQTDLQEWREASLQAIANARTSPAAVGSRILSKALYPAGHPLAPRDDQEERLRALSLEDLRSVHAEWMRPDIAKLFVVGDTTLTEILDELERVFADWKAPPTPARSVPSIAAVPVPEQPRFLLVDWPGEAQTRISVGRFVLPAGRPGDLPLGAANDILGGSNTARLGQRLRSEKGWSYDITSGTNGGLVQQYWGIETAVQGDKTVESVKEILDVVAKFTSDEPATQAELARFVQSESRSLPGLFESAEVVLAAMVQSSAHGRPYDWIEGAPARLNALKLEDVNRLAREYFTPHSFTWVLVGDVSRFEQSLRQAGLGSVEVWDREGRKLR